jgi:hypothetical protein
VPTESPLYTGRILAGKATAGMRPLWLRDAGRVGDKGGHSDAAFGATRLPRPVMKQGMTPGAALDKAFKRAEAIFAKYQIQA